MMQLMFTEFIRRPWCGEFRPDMFEILHARLSFRIDKASVRKFFVFIQPELPGLKSVAGIRRLGDFFKTYPKSLSPNPQIPAIL